MVHVQQTTSWSDRLADGLANGWWRMPARWRRRLVEAASQVGAGPEPVPPGPASFPGERQEPAEPGEPEEAANEPPTPETAAPEAPASEAPAPSRAELERHLPHFRLREQDVRSGYRLLFHRDPTEDEFEHHLHHGWNTGGYDIYHFVEVLLSSSERDEALTRLDEPTAGMLDGMTFYYRPRDTPLGAWTACFGAYETDLADTMENLLRPGGTFLDLGANIGLHTIRAARRVGPKGRVIAVEPNPENHELLRLTIEANGFDQVTVLPVAASDRAGRLAFHVSRGHSNGICQVLPRHWPSDTQTEVPAVRLDDELGFLDQLDLLKIDVEGAEPMALAGMPETLARLRPRILLEFCPHHLLSTAGVDPVEFLASIEAMGYKLLPFVPGEDGAVAVMSPDEILPLPDQHQVSFVNVLADPC